MRLLFIIAFIGVQISAQTAVDTYYSSVNTESPTFISDLQSRIRLPYTKVSYDQYDETIIANYESRDTSGGRRAITCVYSGYVEAYTLPFKWIPGTAFSREHTWCQSWFPLKSATTSTEGSDQHHLFPVNQNSANIVRSNHPLGNVTTVTSTYLDAKYGKNPANQVVYEPRKNHKGDAARALLYMSIRYNGVAGNWTFDNLNNAILPSLSEAPQYVDSLLVWHKQDPPDKWEVERNDYIQSTQKNRNPFIDHPEYVNYINFNNHTKLSPLYAEEPDREVTEFSAIKNRTTVNLIWTNPSAGNQLPSGYLIIGYTKTDYFIPIDGETYNDDTDFSDGAVVLNVLYEEGKSVASFNHSDTSAGYYFQIFAYNGSGVSRNYLISGTTPTANGTLLLPVELTSFSAVVQNNNVLLEWRTATELNNRGFDLERKTIPNPSQEEGKSPNSPFEGKEWGWTKVGFVTGTGSSTSPHTYSFSDNNITPGKYRYRLRQIDIDGGSFYSHEVEVDLGAPTAFALEQNYPNPFNPTTILQYTVSSLPVGTVGKQFVTLKVFDMLGREVAVLVNGEKEPGVYRYELGIRNYELTSGVYFYQLKAGEFVQTKKMTILK